MNFMDFFFYFTASEQVVIRSFPVSTLFKIKSISVHDFPRFSEIRKNLQVGQIIQTYLIC